MIFILFSLVLVISVHVVMTKVIIDPHEEFEECGNGMPMFSMNFSGLEITRKEDGTIFGNGKVKVLKDFNAPMKIFYYTKKLERGSWTRGIFSRLVPDFCATMNNPLELWYNVTRFLPPCPIKAGQEIVLDNLKVGTVLEVVPPNLLGEWRIYNEMTTTRGLIPQSECKLIEFSVVEI
ncbi:uncharacterized protein LOC129750922 [Uranotaenia lowii]|uniref:uncharacterized protein LOC129750922 n=1 Tax=Uranotaenia lowii TaxID=190385 RepID=UPI002479F9EA|nr:uncharacterized protein LOC129750922 [Uranotaenia lowii]